MAYAASLLKDIPIPETEVEDIEHVEYNFMPSDSFTVRRENDYYVVEGPYVEKLINSINFEDYESMSYFQTMLRKKGIIDELEKAGIKENDVVHMGELEFEFVF